MASTPVQAGTRDLWVPVTVMVWIPSVLMLDRGATLWQQYLLGLGTWALLVVLLAREVRLVQVQTAVVIVFATLVEYTFSPLLEVYVYRLENVPAFVPPGHGLVYLAALSMGRSEWFRVHARTLISATLVVGGAYALWGVSSFAPRPDVLGLFWYGCLVGFLAFGRSRLLYVGAFIVVTYLEILGTWFGTWTWAATDTTGIISIGNPPSGAAGGYGWFDLVALCAAPAVVRLLARLEPLGLPGKRLRVE